MKPRRAPTPGSAPILKADGLPEWAARVLGPGWVVPNLPPAERAFFLAQLRLLQRFPPGVAAALEQQIGQFLRETGWSSLTLQKLTELVRGIQVRAISLDGAIETLDWGRAESGLADAFSRTSARLAWRIAEVADRSPVLRNVAAAYETSFPDVQIAFGRPNPAQIPVFREHGLTHVRDIRRVTEAGLRTQLEAALKRGRNPLDVAKELAQTSGFGPTAGQATAIARYRAELEAGRWGAARSRQLHDRRFTAAPTTPEQIDAMVARYAERLRLYRARVIARTEMLSAASTANRAVWEGVVARGALGNAELRQFWVTAPETASTASLNSKAPKRAGPCDRCRPVPFMNPGGRLMDELFETPDGLVEGTPLHPQCRCLIYYRPRFLTLSERLALGD